MHALTIHEAATATGWSPRMLRYLERRGLLAAARSPAAYRVYTAADLERLRSLRTLLDRFGVGPAEVAFAKRLRDEPGLAEAINTWLEAARPRRPQTVAASDWLRFEQEKCKKLLAAAA